MYLTVKQQVKHLSKEEFKVLRELCRYAKNLYNQALYNIRQQYFCDGSYLSYGKNYALLKDSPNYRVLNSNMAQQILMEADGCFRSFFGLVKKAKRGEYPMNDCRIPHYLPKDGYETLVIGFVRVSGNRLVIPFSQSYRKTHKPIEIKMPPMLADRTIKEIRIIPRSNAGFFEIQYTYEAECTERNLNTDNALALDFGVNNLVTAVTNMGKSFIIDGRWLKSVNQWFNKENARLQSIKDRQHSGKKTTRRQNSLYRRRNNRVNDCISKAARKITDYCIENDIGTLVVGYNAGFQKKADMGKRNNQAFVNIPYGILRKRLQYLCEMNGIRFIQQEESYTSKASFFDRDEIPVFDADDKGEHSFSGKRIHRGLYRTASGKVLNADVNGALNILRKSNVVDLNVLYSRGGVDTPVRIRVA